MYYNYRKSEYLGPQAVSLVERSIIHCPYLGGSTVGGSTVLFSHQSVRNSNVYFDCQVTCKMLYVMVYFDVFQIIENVMEVEENELLITLEAQGLVGLVHCTKQVWKLLKINHW